MTDRTVLVCGHFLITAKDVRATHFWKASFWSNILTLTERPRMVAIDVV